VRDQLRAEPELRMLFKHPTIAEFAALLDNAEASVTTVSIPRVAHKDGAILSFAQQRLWFLDALEGGSAAYNITWPIKLIGPLDYAALEQALNMLVERHEALRTTFPSVDGEAVQMVAAHLHIDLLTEKLLDVPDAELRQYLTKLAAHKFDLSAGPLFGARLLQIGEHSHILVILIHHIIADAWSMEVIYRELVELYGAALEGRPAKLPELPIQYADYAIWQQRMLDSDEFRRQ
jgi:hypothetical protein